MLVDNCWLLWLHAWYTLALALHVALMSLIRLGVVLLDGFDTESWPGVKVPGLYCVTQVSFVGNPVTA